VPLVIAALVLAGCYNPLQRTRQIRSFETIKLVCQRLEELRVKSGGTVPEQEFSAAVRSIRNGQDEWGQPVLFSIRTAPAFSYVVVSTGSDRRLDVNSMGDFFSMAKVDIRGSTKRDIVFRDGEAITNASKDPHTDYPRLE